MQPGVVLDHLRNAAEKYHLTFAPDPATHDRCTIGGMIGNNSCGVHSVMAGKTDDNIEELEVVTYDGVRLKVGQNFIHGATDAFVRPGSRGRDASVETDAFVRPAGTTESCGDSRPRLSGGPSVGTDAFVRPGGPDSSGRSDSDRCNQIHSSLNQLADEYADLIRQKFPQIPRRVSGYNLNHLLPENGFHIARALVGSEGTCATTLEATCRLVESPPSACSRSSPIPTFFNAPITSPKSWRTSPSVWKDSTTSRLLHSHKRHQPEGLALLPEGGGWLHGRVRRPDTAQHAESQARAMIEALQRGASPPNAHVYSGPQAKRMWEVREASLGVTSHVPGEPLNWEGWEDAAVAPEKLGGYLRDLRKMMAAFGYNGSLYGHFGHACVHTRLNFDLQSKPGIAKFRKFVEEAADLVVGYGGSLSGEHGDGQARAELLPKMFGPELMQAFRKFKSAWDPTGK